MALRSSEKQLTLARLLRRITRICIIWGLKPSVAIKHYFFCICFSSPVREAQCVDLYSHSSQQYFNASITFTHLWGRKLFLERQAWISQACFLQGSLLGCAICTFKTSNLSLDFPEFFLNKGHQILPCYYLWWSRKNKGFFF